MLRLEKNPATAGCPSGVRWKFANRSYYSLNLGRNRCRGNLAVSPQRPSSFPTTLMASGKPTSITATRVKV